MPPIVTCTCTWPELRKLRPAAATGKLPPEVITVALNPLWKLDPFTVSVVAWFTVTWFGVMELMVGCRFAATT